MATLTANTVIGILHGRMGNLVFAQAPNGRVIVRRSPIRKAPATSGELLNRSKFAASVAYLKGVILTPGLYEAYRRQARLKNKRPCDLAISDFHHPPEIRDIEMGAYKGRAGDPIKVEAVDDFHVEEVFVTLARLDREVIELGPAVPDDVHWVYRAQTNIALPQTVVVHATVADYAGNMVTKLSHWSIG